MPPQPHRSPAARDEPLCLVVLPGRGLAMAWEGGSREVATDDPAGVVARLSAGRPRWTWWSARDAAPELVASGVRPPACWDLGAVGRLLHGLRRDDPAAVWAAQAGLDEPPVVRRSAEPGAPALFELDGSVAAASRAPDSRVAGDGDGLASGPVREDGHLRSSWADGGWARDLSTARRWAELGLDLQRRQAALLRQLPDPRRLGAGTEGAPLALLIAQAESAAAVLAVELEHDGLPLDREHAAGLLRGIIGDRPPDEAARTSARQARDAAVLRHFPGSEGVDLRSPLQVRALLARIGLDVPDTRSWRLEPHAATSQGVAALLAWRKAERTATTYGWRWLDSHVGGDGRLRGAWSCADGGAGRMTAQAGLHNLPIELRAAVRAEPGYRLVRADLGQIEPRVLAAVSGDEALTAAARAPDLYAPVAERLRCDRPTAKVAVLAAMYGQTTGPAGQALRQMDQAYPRAMAYLRSAEDAGHRGRDLRTYGGRLLRLRRTDDEDAAGGGRGRYARNAVIQGAAAEFFKAWAATVRAGLGPRDGQIVLCLHDELLLQVPEARTANAVRLLGTSLDATARWWAAGSEVRFLAEITTGSSWADSHRARLHDP